MIIGKFDYEKNFYSVILLVTNKNLEKNFNYIILSVFQTIYLSINSNKKSLFDVEKIS